MERHIMFEFIADYNLHINHKELRLFSNMFRVYYNIVDKMRVKGLPINQNQVELYAMIENIEIDKTFPRKLDSVPRERLEDTINLYIIGKEQETDYERMERLLQEGKKGSRRSLEELHSLVGEKTKLEDENYGVIEIGDALDEQMQFINRLYKRLPLDGLYLYQRGGFDQFMKLSYRLKLIDLTDLVVIAGRPSVGKTSFAISLANAFSKNGYNGLFFSLEQSNDQLVHRMTLAKSGISNNQLHNPNGITMDMYKHYVDGLNEVAKVRLKVIDNPPREWLKMKELIYANKDKIDYVMIDHLNYISSYSGENASNFHTMVTKVTSDMKQLAKELKIPIILLAQFSRSLGQHSRRDDRYIEPFMRDLRESGSIEQDADKILLLYRKWEDNRGEYETYGRYKVICKIDKNRSGATGSVEYWFHANLNRWSEVQDEQDEQDYTRRSRR